MKRQLSKIITYKQGVNKIYSYKDWKKKGGTKKILFSKNYSENNVSAVFLAT
jgi:hypothetical protein